jgi:predicted RNase H-like nuclease (RuvC/YqgF family)
VIEAGESGVPIGDAEANDLRRELDRTRTEVLNLTSENKRLRSDLEQKSVMVADLSARVDDATRRVGSSNGPGSGVKAGENATQVGALVDRINRLEAALSAARQENERLKGA